MGPAQQCVAPEACPCERAGASYWPGQQVKAGCELCVCERGRVQRCRPNAGCSGESVTSDPCSLSSEWPSHHPLSPSALWLVPLERVGGVPGPLRGAKRPVVLQEPQQPDAARRREDVQRRLQEGPQVPRDLRGPETSEARDLRGPETTEARDLRGPETSEARDLRGPETSEAPRPQRPRELRGPESSEAPRAQRPRELRGPRPQRPRDLRGPSRLSAHLLTPCVCRCQTAPCGECEYRGQFHAVGDRWRSERCQLCHCEPSLTVQCAPYCPHAATGCPQVRVPVCMSVCV